MARSPPCRIRMEPGSEGENYPESLGNTFAVATMAGKDEASKQKSDERGSGVWPPPTR